MTRVSDKMHYQGRQNELKNDGQNTYFFSFPKWK